MLPVIKNRDTLQQMKISPMRELEKLFTDKYLQAETGGYLCVRFSTLQINSSIANNFILQMVLMALSRTDGYINVLLPELIAASV